MWVFGYPYILHFVLHGLNSMRPRYMYMHLWNDVIAGLDSGLLTIGAKALSKPMPIYCLYTPNQIPDMLTNTNSFELVTFRIIFLLLLTNSYTHYLRTCSDKQESFTCKHPWRSCYIWHCVPNILLWSILCKTVGLPSSTGESERTARRQFHSPTLRCFRGRLCEVAAGRGPLKQSRWPESNWTLPLRSVGVAPSLGRFWLVFTAFKLRYVLRRHIILSDSDGNQGVLDCFTVYPGLGGSAK